MAEEFWLTAAKCLEYGGRDKIQCCGRDASRSIAHTNKGYVSYCFRCGDRGFEPHGRLSIASIMERKRITAEVQAGTLKLPRDFTLDIPMSDAVWLLRGGVPLNISRHYGFGYSKYWNRVILPVKDKDELVAFTSRSTIGEKPKYIARYKYGTATFTADYELALPSARSKQDDYYASVVVTEDILSCCRVGRVRSCIALLGTSAGIGSVTSIMAAAERTNGKVLLWLDGDRAGIGASQKLSRSLELHGLDVGVISTPLDPKRYSNRVIAEILKKGKL